MRTSADVIGTVGTLPATPVGWLITSSDTEGSGSPSMRRDVVNALTRVRRDLRFQLADRYRALLGSRFVVLTTIAAAVVDRGLWLRSAVRRAKSTARTRPESSAAVVRAVVTGGDQLSLTLGGAPAGTDAVALRRGSTVRPLPTIVGRGGLLRLLATLPADVCDGDDWTVAVTTAGTPHDVVVIDPAALATRLSPPRRRAVRAAEPQAAAWPPRLREDAGRLLLRAQSPADAGVGHVVEVGVRTAIVTWSVTADAAALVLVADGTERTLEATVEAGTARVHVDLRAFAEDGSWVAFAGDATGRRILDLPRGTFPPLDDTGRPHRVPLPTRGSTGRAVEVGYTPDNQLVFRVGNVAPAAS